MFIESLKDIIDLKPALWKNNHKPPFSSVFQELRLGSEDILDAERRLERFAPLIKELFPDTLNGVIESPLVSVKKFKGALEKHYRIGINGSFFVKCDSQLKVAGSIKARGGIYEVLKLAETISRENHLLDDRKDYTQFMNTEHKNLFTTYEIIVGSTGNLGMSIGIMASSLGFRVTVHMSSDAKAWKKQRLKERGVQVVEHQDDYSKAVSEGRKQCDENPNGRFIDDENSKDLFLGYSVAALRLKRQLQAQKIAVDDAHPLYVYLPCGVGGAPGGIAFGLKHIFGDAVHCYFVEPTHAPCMLLGLMTKKYEQARVQDYGIDGRTEADGLAVGQPSKLVSRMAEKLIDGIYTIEDDALYPLLTLLQDEEGIKIEPSAAAGLLGPTIVSATKGATHIAWLTGGMFLPEDLYEEMYRKGHSYLEKLTK